MRCIEVLGHSIRGMVEHSGLCAGVDEFDATLFRVSAAEAAAMDAQQRLLLEVSHEVITAAGARAAEPRAKGCPPAQHRAHPAQTPPHPPQDGQVSICPPAQFGFSCLPTAHCGQLRTCPACKAGLAGQCLGSAHTAPRSDAYLSSKPA